MLLPLKEIIPASPKLLTANGDEAVESLKKSGQYDALMDALKQSRGKDGEVGQDAIGQSAELTASDGAGSDLFGNAISISGDTAVVGAKNHDVGGNSNQGAAYVFTRAGTAWTQEAILTAAGGAADDEFGASVAISGSLVIVGADGDNVGSNPNQGSAYVFIRSGTTWTQQAQLTATDGGAGDHFGISVAMSGDTALVGAFFDIVGGNNSQGSAYVFTRSGTTWTEQAKLTASDGSATDWFGYGVAISGNTAVVGAYQDDVGANIDQGSVYVFIRSGVTWTQQAQLTAADGVADDEFGDTVAISGDTAIVGTFKDDVGANDGQGSAYVFTRSGTTWTQQAQLTALDGSSSDHFGYSVAISGNTAVVGAAYYNVGGTGGNPGRAYVFTRSGTTWTQQEQLAPSDGGSGDRFGVAVAISGSNIIIGANGHDVGTNTSQGSAYVYRSLTNTWAQDARKVASNGAASDYFGYSVAISDNTAVVGARFDNVGGNADQGSAYVFVRSGGTWTQQAQLTASDGAATDYFGSSVAISGDTVVVGAPNDDVGANANQGSAYVFVRSGTTWTQEAQLIGFLGQDANDLFGSSVAIWGNTAVVGLPNGGVGPPAEGAAHVFTRSGTTWTFDDLLQSDDGTADDYLGTSVAIFVNTIVVGAPGDNDGGTSDVGSAYVFIRTGSVWTQQAKLIPMSGGAADDQFGASVAISGDTVLVGAPYDNIAGDVDRGAAFVFTRSGTTWTQQMRLLATAGAAGDIFGWSVALSGDTAVVGAYQADVGANGNQGSAYLFVRSGTSWTQQAQLTAAEGAASDFFGWSVAAFGDKVMVGAPLSDSSTSSPIAPQVADQGAAFFFINDFAPTAAGASISGRVLTSQGSGLTNAIVHLTMETGETLTTRTSSFGYYRFDDVAVGQNVILAVTSKRYHFTPRLVSIYESVRDVDFTGEQ